MTTIEWMVVLAAAGAIGWVNWYFFFARSPAAAALGGAEVTITVQGGYSPSVVRATAGRPVRLVFHRLDTAGCTEEVVFPDFGIRRFLPSGEKTTIEVTPPAAGRYEFTCGMSMVRGSLIAEPAGGE